MNLETWLNHLKKLSSDNAKLRAENQYLKGKISRLTEAEGYYREQFAKQSAAMLTMSIKMDLDYEPRTTCQECEGPYDEETGGWGLCVLCLNSKHLKWFKGIDE